MAAPSDGKEAEPCLARQARFCNNPHQGNACGLAVPPPRRCEAGTGHATFIPDYPILEMRFQTCSQPWLCHASVSPRLSPVCESSQFDSTCGAQSEHKGRYMGGLHNCAA